MRARTLLSNTLVSTSCLFACSAPSGRGAAAVGEAITSDAARILDFQFEAEVLTSSDAEAKKAIISQLMYAQGLLTTAGNGNGQIGNVQLSNLREAIEADRKRVKYQASLPVAWPKDVSAPPSYDLTLPVDTTSFDTFNAKYDGRCGKSSFSRESFWHDWNPKASGCSVDEGDVTKSSAVIAPYERETTRKYPEYDLIWADDRLDVAAIFGIISSNAPGDWGYIEAKRFIDNAGQKLDGVRMNRNETTPSILQDTTLSGRLTLGDRAREVRVDVLVVPKELASAGGDFEARYDGLSEKADLILYNGHAGLGKNLNTLARKGRVPANKYQLVLLNGCQSFAYIDTTLTDRRREANGGGDPIGTRFLDVVGNALPAYANNLATVSNDLYDAVLRADAPKHYNELLRQMPADQVAVVFGEEDNRFSP